VIQTKKCNSRKESKKRERREDRKYMKKFKKILNGVAFDDSQIAL